MPAYIRTTKKDTPKIPGWISQYYRTDSLTCIKPAYQDGLNRPSFFPLPDINPGCKADPLTSINRENESFRSFSENNMQPGKPYLNMIKNTYVTEEERDKYAIEDKNLPIEVRPPAPVPNIFRQENNIPFKTMSVMQSPVTSVKDSKLKKIKLKVNENVALTGLQERNNTHNEGMNKKIGGCKGTMYGCCDDGVTEKNKSGSNCPKLS